jgi:hypothetical protein
VRRTSDDGALARFLQEMSDEHETNINEELAIISDLETERYCVFTLIIILSRYQKLILSSNVCCLYKNVYTFFSFLHWVSPLGEAG